MIVIAPASESVRATVVLEVVEPFKVNVLSELSVKVKALLAALLPPVPFTEVLLLVIVKVDEVSVQFVAPIAYAAFPVRVSWLIPAAVI